MDITKVSINAWTKEVFCNETNKLIGYLVEENGVWIVKWNDKIK